MSGALFAACGDKATDKNDEEQQQVSLSEKFANVKNVIAEDLQAGGVEEPLVDGKLSSYFEVDLTDKENPDQAFFLEKLGIEENQLAAGYVIAAMMNVNSDEIILLEATDETAAASLKEALEKELAAQKQTWEQYLPDQYEKVKNNQIKQNGNQFIYITYDQPEKIEEIFDATAK